MLSSRARYRLRVALKRVRFRQRDGESSVGEAGGSSACEDRYALPSTGEELELELLGEMDIPSGLA